MQERTEQATRRLGRQSDPEPPDYLPPRPPSLILYALLAAVAFGLIVWAFRIGDKPDWPGLLVNLSTELLGAILVLLMVEQRIRASEMRFILTLPGTTKETIADWLSPEVRQVKTYASLFVGGLDSVSPPGYLPQSDTELKLEERCVKGFVLVGGGGSGKSTQLHRLARGRALDALKRPREAHVPVLVPVLKWENGDAADDALRKTMKSYSRISDRVFRRLLERGRLMCMFDGLDDSPMRREFAEELKKFHAAHPRAPLIVSTCEEDESFLRDLEAINLELKPETVAQIIEMRSRPTMGFRSLRADEIM